MPKTSELVIFWKTDPGQQVSTTVDSLGDPVLRDEAWLEANQVVKLETPAEVFDALKSASGVMYALTPELARKTLGWDV